MEEAEFIDSREFLANLEMIYEFVARESPVEEFEEEGMELRME